MIYIARWKVISIIVICALAVLYSAPNLMTNKSQEWMETSMPGWLPNKTINLGLDLQGGAHLLLEVDVDVALAERSDDILQTIRPELRQNKIGYTRLTALQRGVRILLKDSQNTEQALDIIRKIDNELSTVVSDDKKTLEATLSDSAVEKITDQIIEQSIEIVRRRVDETGTREPTIQRQGKDRILVQLPGLEDPEYIKEILGKTAKLTFHLVQTDLRGSIKNTGGSLKYPLMEDPTQILTVARRAMVTGDMLTNAQPTMQQGMTVVSFKLNSIGARKFCDVTRNNVNKPFAIVLDEEIISAPRINEAICGGAAIITGNFSVQEANDLALLLRAGALPAPLKILEERTVGPSLGADSVSAGKKASIVAFSLVIVFMVISYGLFGLYAVVALLMNVALIFALLSTLQATLTLPGIAGIVLTIGMAVDANVLIFERIREEVRQGRSPMAAVDSGYSRAMSTIVDSNLTTLIAAIILFSFGTGPIKGFAVTLGIGILTSFFSAIMITRLFVVTWLHKKKPDELPV